MIIFIIIIPAVPGNCRDFDSTFERQGYVFIFTCWDLSGAFGRTFFGTLHSSSKHLRVKMTSPILYLYSKVQN